MLDLKEYKRRYIDKYGVANMMLVNGRGETLDLGPAETVKHQTNGKLKMRWKCKDIPAQWLPYTAAAFYHKTNVVFVHEISPLDLFDKPQSSVVIYFDYD